MERLSIPKQTKELTKGEKFLVKSLPAICTLPNSQRAMDSIGQGNYRDAIVGTAFGIGMGLIGSHLILNEGFKLKESARGVKNWTTRSLESVKPFFPSRKRAAISGVFVATGLLLGARGTIQATEGDLGKATNTATLALFSEGVAVINILQPLAKKQKEYDISILGGSLSRQTELLEGFDEVLAVRKELVSDIISTTNPESQQ